MNRNDLYKSFAEVNDDALLRTESQHTMHRTHFRMSLIAASLALVLCLCGISFLFNRSRSKDNTFSWFVITAYAADADLEELGLKDGFFNSGGTGEPLFDADTPLFCFTVKPVNWEGNQEAYSNFVLTVSRNGKIIDSFDDHVLVMHKYPVPGFAAPYECEVVGWLEEDANIIITISDKETGALIEEQTVHVRYSADSQAYQLTVTNVQTNELE